MCLILKQCLVGRIPSCDTFSVTLFLLGVEDCNVATPPLIDWLLGVGSRLQCKYKVSLAELLRIKWLGGGFLAGVLDVL